MGILHNNKSKIQAAFVKSLSIIDDGNKSYSILKLNEKIFFQKLRGFLPHSEWVKDLFIVKKIEDLTLYHKSNQCPSEPNIFVELLLFEKVRNGEKKYFVKIQY